MELRLARRPADPASDPATPRARRSVWTVITGVVGGVMGLAPHVLHHLGPLVGTALVAGTGGTVLFGVLGLAATIPLLVRLKRRFVSWWAPVIALAAFAVMFAVSSLVLGPLISGGGEPAPPAVTPTDHDTHHE